MDITMGEIIDALEKEIFIDSERTAYRERERLLKKFIDITWKQSLHIISESTKEDVIQTFYKTERVKHSLRQLSNYIAYLCHQLTRDNIIKYCDKQGILLTNSDIDISFLLAHSYYGNIEYDLYWISELKLYDAIGIANGSFEIERFSTYLPATYKHFENLTEKQILKNKFYSDFETTFNEIKICYKNNLLKACNLLLLTSIEGLVRKIGGVLVEKQNLRINPSDKKYNSLDSFLRNIPWEKDFKISVSEYRRITAKMDFDPDRSSSLLDDTNISLKDRLDFLRRRFKEDRDLILHGVENNFGKEWQTYINFKALEEVFETINYYLLKYKIQ